MQMSYNDRVKAILGDNKLDSWYKRILLKRLDEEFGGTTPAPSASPEPAPTPAPGPAPSPSPTPAPDAGADAFLKQLDFRDEQADRPTPTPSPQQAQVIPDDLQKGTIFNRTDKPVGLGYAPRYNPEPGELVMPRVESIYSGLPVEQKLEIQAEQDKAQQLQLARRAQNIVISNALKAATRYTQGVQKLAMGAAEAATQAATNQKVVEQYGDVLTNYLKEKGRDYYYGLDGHYEKFSAIGKPGISYELFDWLDKGYDIGDLMLPEAAEGGKGFVETAAEYLSIGTHPALSLLRIPVPWDHQPTPEEYAANIEKWASAIGLSPQEKQKLLDPVYRNVHGLKEDEIREFIPCYDDIDVLIDTPKMKIIRDWMKKAIEWGVTEEEEKDWAKLRDVYLEEIAAQTEEYEAKYGHAMPSMQDVESIMTIDPGINNPWMAAGRTFVAGPTLGLSELLFKGVMPEESFAAFNRATATHPLARDVGDVGGIAIPIDLGALVAGPAFKLIGKGINKIGGKIFSKVAGEVGEAAAKWGVKEATPVGRMAGVAADIPAVPRAAVTPATPTVVRTGAAAPAHVTGATAQPVGVKGSTAATRPASELRGLQPWEMTLDEWRLVGDNGKGKAYAPNASGKTAQAINAGVDARYKLLVEAAVGEGKAVPGFVREQSMFTGRVSRTAGPRYPLTKTEFDARFNAGERIPNGEIAPAKQKHPLTQSEYNAMIGERPAQTAPRSTKEPLPVPETARGRSVEGRSVERGSAGKAGEPAIVGAGKTREGAPAGKGTEAGDDGFREGLLGEEGKRVESASDDFTEGLLGKEGKAGTRGEHNTERISKGEIAPKNTGNVINIKNLEDFFDNPRIFGDATPNEWYRYFQENGYNPQPLGSKSSLKGVPFDQGGGFRIHWDGDRYLQYHPSKLSHHGGAYWKISSGPTGTIRVDMNGNLIP